MGALTTMLNYIVVMFGKGMSLKTMLNYIVVMFGNGCIHISLLLFQSLTQDVKTRDLFS